MDREETKKEGPLVKSGARCGVAPPTTLTATTSDFFRPVFPHGGRAKPSSPSAPGPPYEEPEGARLANKSVGHYFLLHSQV